jgi:hypothetical protein
MNHLGKVTKDEQNFSRFEPSTDMPLDAGIRHYVLALRSGGIDTFESCEGGEGHAFTEPTVRFHGAMAEGFKAYAVAKELGLPVYALRLSYSVDGDFLMGPWWEMVFATTDIT